MITPTPTSAEPSDSPADSSRWKWLGSALLRYGAIYSIFGVCGVAFLLYRAVSLLVRGPGNSGL